MDYLTTEKNLGIIKFINADEQFMICIVHSVMPKEMRISCTGKNRGNFPEG